LNFARLSPPQKTSILAAPLGARARKARLGGVFSVGKAAEKTDFIEICVINNWQNKRKFGEIK